MKRPAERARLAAGGRAAKAVRLASTAAMAVGSTLGCGLLLNAELPVSALLMFPVLKVAAHTVLQAARSRRCTHDVKGTRAVRNGRVARIARAVSTALSLGFTAFIAVGILITPYSSYRIWMESLGQGPPGGTVSSLLTLLFSFFAVHLALLVSSMGVVWPLLGTSLVAASLLAFALREPRFFLVVAAATAAALAYLTLRYSHRGRRLRATALTAGMSAAALLLALLFTGGGEPRGNRIVDTGVYPFLRKTVTGLFPGFPLVYAVPGYGYSFEETAGLGGKPVLSRAGIFAVRGHHSGLLYLRTRAYDLYDGHSWRLSSRPAPEVGPDGLPAAPSMLRQEDRRTGARGASMELELLTEYYSYVPHTLDTVRVLFPEGYPGLKQGSVAFGFELAYPIRRGQSLVLVRAGEDGGRPSEARTAEDALERYLQVPAALPGEITVLAERIAEGAPDAETVLTRIEKYLAYNYSYDLEDEMGRGYRDFVHGFLFESGSGYCVHFATSFAILARLNGIPVRYATGFLLTPSSPGEPSLVTGLASHAWPEVWRGEEGWVAWEATPALDVENYTIGDDLWLYNLSAEMEGLTGRQLRSIMGPVRTARPEEAEGEVEGRSDRPWRSWWLWAGGPATVLLLTGAAALALRAARRPSATRRANRTLLARARRMGSLFDSKGAGPPPAGPEAVGWLAWGREMERRLPGMSGALRRMTAIILRVVYSPRRPTRRDVRFVRLLHRAARRRIKT